MTLGDRVVIEDGPLGTDGGRAWFSVDRRFRYMLERRYFGNDRIAVFLMLNPSTADAFKLDPTVRRCVEFAQRWGCDRLRVVNLFALRSPHPADLYATWRASRDAVHRIDVSLERVGADEVNDRAILHACQGIAGEQRPHRVVAAWGNHGDDPRLGYRARKVRTMLEGAGVELYHLGLTSSGAPLHPLARGKNWIPYERELERWAA